MAERDATAGDGAAPGIAEPEQPAAGAGEAAGGEQGAAAAGAPAGASSRPRRGDKAPRRRPKAKRARAAAGDDPAPSSGLPKGAALKAANAKLEAAIAEVLVFPAVPAMMLAPDDESRAYLPEHFMRSGPATAHELVKASERSPELRAILERVAYGSSMFGVVFAGLAYAAPPVMWMLGLRAQAAQITMMASMSESELAAGMMAARAAAEAHAQQPPAPDAAGAADGGPAGAAAAAAGADQAEL